MLWQSHARLPSNRRPGAAQGSPRVAQRPHSTRFLHEPVSIPNRVRDMLRSKTPLLPDRHPNLETAIAGERIEVCVIALEVGRIGRSQTRRRQPVIPDRVDGAANGRDMVAVREDRISLFGNPDAMEFARQVGEVGYFDAGDIIKISGVIAIAADAVSHLPDPAGNVRHRLMKALPLAGNAGAVLMVIALANTGDEQRPAGFKTRRVKIVCEG